MLPVDLVAVRVSESNLNCFQSHKISSSFITGRNKNSGELQPAPSGAGTSPFFLASTITEAAAPVSASSGAVAKIKQRLDECDAKSWKTFYRCGNGHGERVLGTCSLKYHNDKACVDRRRIRAHDALYFYRQAFFDDRSLKHITLTRQSVEFTKNNKVAFDRLISRFVSLYRDSYGGQLDNKADREAMQLRHKADREAMQLRHKAERSSLPKGHKADREAMQLRHKADREAMQLRYINNEIVVLDFRCFGEHNICSLTHYHAHLLVPYSVFHNAAWIQSTWGRLVGDAGVHVKVKTSRTSSAFNYAAKRISGDYGHRSTGVKTLQDGGMSVGVYADLIHKGKHFSFHCTTELRRKIKGLSKTFSTIPAVRRELERLISKKASYKTDVYNRVFDDLERKYHKCLFQLDDTITALRKNDLQRVRSLVSGYSSYNLGQLPRRCSKCLEPMSLVAVFNGSNLIFGVVDQLLENFSLVGEET